MLFIAVAGGLVAVREAITGAPALATDNPATSSINPASATAPNPAGGRTAFLKKEADGHFWTTAYIDGAPIRLMVDTGATVIALTERDARRIGIDTAALPRNMQVSTAAGKVRVASATLATVKIERVSVSNVQAAIIDEGLEHSLLGMSFLNQLDGWEVTPRAIVIRQ